MLINFDTVIEMINEGHYDSYFCVEIMIGDNVVEQIYTPEHFVDLCLFNNCCVPEELKQYIEDSINNKYLTAIRIKLFLKEGNKHERIQVLYKIGIDMINEIKTFIHESYIDNIFMSIKKEALEKLLE